MATEQDNPPALERAVNNGVQFAETRMDDARLARRQQIAALAFRLTSRQCCMHEALVCASIACSIEKFVEGDDDVGAALLLSHELAMRLEALWQAIDATTTERAA